MSQFSVDQAFRTAVEHHHAGRLILARALYRQVLAQQPEHADAFHFSGVIAHQLGENDVAVKLIAKAIALNPNSPEAHANLGVSLRDMGRLDEAITAYRKAISLAPHYPEAHHNLGLALLLRGDFAEGWNEFEWRWQCKDFPGSGRIYDQPIWDGSDLGRRTIFLHAEQGFGDAIQFLRYVPLVAARGGKILLGCDPELRRLVQDIPGISRWVGPAEPTPPFDVHCPLMSLPVALNTTQDSVPGTVPYLQPNPEEARRWRNEMLGQRLNVGLAWAGRPSHGNDRNRSVSLSALAPLARVPGVRYYSLQKGEAAKQATDPPPGLELVNRTEELHDFADSAALIANLDLVISVDTAVAHLAGAMGKPVWTLLPFMPDWRWLLERNDSRWYPTMRLFRQRSRGDWDGIVSAVSEALSVWLLDFATR